MDGLLFLADCALMAICIVVTRVFSYVAFDEHAFDDWVSICVSFVSLLVTIAAACGAVYFALSALYLFFHDPIWSRL